MDPQTSSTFVRASQVTKKLICFFCRVLLATVVERCKDQDFYVLESDKVENWQLKATPMQTRFPQGSAFPVICRFCKSEIGACQEGRILLNSFRIKHVEQFECSTLNHCYKVVRNLTKHFFSSHTSRY